MSNSLEISESERFVGRKSGKPAIERSNFTQTCSLLRQFLKEKGPFVDLSRGMSGILEAKGRPETFRPQVTMTMNLLPNMEKPAGEISGQNCVSPPNFKSMDFFPQFARSAPSDSGEDAVDKTDFRKLAKATEPETAQMTIFYGGQVLVYNDFPADKAREIMALASKGISSQNSSHSVSNPIKSSGSAAPGSNIVSTSGANTAQESLQRRPQAFGSDMPIARKNSLHRFLEKRKDRSTARAPYQVTKPFAAPRKSEGSNPMADMVAQSSEQLLELTL